MDAAIPVTVVGETTDDLLVRAALLDLDDFAAIYDRYKVPLFRYLRANGATEDDALDLVALTFERAIRALPRYRSQDGGLRAWLFRIGRNARIDDHRRSSRVSSLSLMGEHTSSGSLTRDPDLHVALRRLAPPARDAVAMRYAGGLTTREIAVVLGKRPEAVQKLIERALDTLREALDER